MQMDYDHGVPNRGESCSVEYRVELRELANKVICGELTRDEAQCNDLHHAYNMYGIDVSVELDKLLRDHAMSVAPEWTAYQIQCIKLLLESNKTLEGQLGALTDWCNDIIRRADVGESHDITRHQCGSCGECIYDCVCDGN